MKLSLTDFVNKANALIDEGKGDAPMGIMGEGEDRRIVIEGGSFGGRKVKQLVVTESNKEIWEALDNALKSDTPGIRSAVLKDLMDSSKALTARKVLQIINRHFIEKKLNDIEKMGNEIQKSVHDREKRLDDTKMFCTRLDTEISELFEKVLKNPQALEGIGKSALVMK